MKELEGLTKDGKKRSRKTKSGTKTKVCSYCSKRKYRDKFVTGRMCKACKIKYDEERYLEKKTEIDSRMREYGRTEKGREVNRCASEKYRATPARKRSWKRWYEALKDNSETYPEYLKAKRANNAVHYAIKTGKIVRGTCEVCESIDTEAHHEDYNKPLEIRWLCTLHHGVLRRLEV